MGNSFGKQFKITTFGESHGKAVGVVIDGCPPGLALGEKDIQPELDRRRPGQSTVTTTRNEKDEVKILSGVYQGKTTGGPITMIVKNKDIDSSKYLGIKNTPRPGHADYTYLKKYGVWQPGGGRSSARETIGRVAAGAVAKKILSKKNITVAGHVVQVGKIRAKPVEHSKISKLSEKNPLRCADQQAAEKMISLIQEAKKQGDSVGGVIEIIATGVPPGLGEPVFDKLSADLAKALMSIPAVKGVEIGSGFASAEKKGSENNDAFTMNKGKVVTKTNNAGGILGGISNGMPIVLRIAVKPTASILKKQDTVDLSKNKNTKISIEGRHDPCICPRAVPVAEAMVAVVLADHLLMQKA